MFPTPVGMSPLHSPDVDTECGVPHTRGDEPVRERDSINTMMCSPHPWG